MVDAKIVASVVSTLADQAAKNVAVKTGADLSAISSVIADEVGRIEAQLSVLLAHVEGRYESEIANLKLEIARLTPSPARSFLGRLFGSRKVVIREYVAHHPV
jgi:hypothetical protein